MLTSSNAAAVNGEKERAPSPVPTVASTSCCSEHSLGESVDNDLPSPRSGLKPGVSPSRTCDQRKLSTAVVSKPDAEHKLLQGRPRRLLSHKAAKAVVTVAATSTVPPPDYALDPPPLRMNAWSEANATDFNIRSTTYLSDKKKITSQPSVFTLLTTDLVKVDAPIFSGLCSHPNERIQMALRKEQETGVRELPEFIYAVNLAVPGRSTYHFVAYFGLNDTSVLRDPTTPLGRVAERFFFGDSDDFRNQTFKLIPRVQGNYMVRKAVGNKPSILGAKLKHHYIRTDRFFEMVIDIGSNKMAQKIVKLAQGCAKSLEVDMMFVLEGIDKHTLPERIMGGVRVSHLDFKHKDGQRICRQPA